tara:strand:+ start:437 stop:751 length:315 start_codon:yes stop_codon:yes gene_type:complete
MSTVTIGSFLREKAQNMAKWLREEGIEHTLGPLQELQAVALAQALREHYNDAIEQRCFGKLCDDKENIPPEVLQIVLLVWKREDLHDKFWRYLKLFSDTVSNDE